MNTCDLENVKTVERGEEALRSLGFRQFRVRFHGKLVRIEIAQDELATRAHARNGPQDSSKSSSRWASTT